MQATSEQTTDANIYVIGGLAAGPTSQPQYGSSALRQCLQIDANLTVYEREAMKVARYCTPLALVRDRFILALGGLGSNSSYLASCECYDTHTNHWFQIQDMPAPCAKSSAVVMNQRFVYVMPGTNTDMRQP